MQELTLTTPALLFSAISLILLAYTNRFVSYAQLIRSLKEKYLASHEARMIPQIANLRKRLYLIQVMQILGIGSLLCCVVSMFFLYVSLFFDRRLYFRSRFAAAGRFAGSLRLGDQYLGQSAGNSFKRH